MFTGSRVIRGSGWKSDDQDGGDGHLGTVVEYRGAACAATDPDTLVNVIWDNGNISSHDITSKDNPELLLFDSGPAGKINICMIKSSFALCTVLFSVEHESSPCM